MNWKRLIASGQRSMWATILMGLTFVTVAGCGTQPVPIPPAATAAKQWLGIPSAINHVITFLHESTGWLLNKSDVSIVMLESVRPLGDSYVADFRVKVEYLNESFETTAKDIPCDELGIPTEESVERLREAVETIKEKMKRLQL